MKRRQQVRRPATRVPRATRSDETAQLRARLARQATELEDLRADVARLRQVVLGRDTELERALYRLAATDLPGEDANEVGYRCMIQRLRRLVSEHSSIGRRAVVLSGGDEALLQHAGCRATHLTQDRFGSCSTPLPESNRSVIVQLEAARARCADLLIIPTSGRWWVERFPDFASYLTRRYVLRADEPDAGMLWDLRSASPLRDLDDLVTGLRAGPSQPAILDWQREYDIAALLSECNVFTPEQSGSSLPYLDGSVDVVTVSNPAPEVLAEARRVAGTAVAVFSGSTHQPSVDLVWPLEITEWRGTQVSVVVKCALDEVPSSAFLCQLDETRPRDLETEILLPIANGRSLRDSLGDVEVVPCRDDSWGSRLRSAAASASGDVVVVIDSELWPLAGWLPPLVQVLRHRADAGVVTGLLVTPDGRVPIGAAAQNGASGPQSDDPGSVAHSYVRRLDAAPDELFATHRQLLLDRRSRRRKDVEPPSSLYTAVTADGMKVLCQPEALVVRPWPPAVELPETAQEIP